MATLVFGIVGGSLGGPLGALIGAQLGNRLDRRLLGIGKPPKPALDANRLVLDSAYGAPIPLVYGQARVAGHVVWATEIDERRHDRPRGGKGGGGGGGRNARFSYFISLAVAVSARPIQRIARIWADGKLLRDANGQPLVPFTMTVYPGSAEQPPDPTIQAQEGVADTPPMRGLAYVVIEDLPLSEFGNRIPNLSFEVVADETLDLATLLGDLAARAGVTATTSPALARPLAGLTIAAELPARQALEAVIETFDLLVREQPGGLHFLAPEDAVALAVDPGLFGAAAGAQHPAPVTRDRQDRARLPVGIDLAFLDPARDYQRAIERARRRQPVGRRIETVESPFVLDAATARAQAQRLLVARHRAAERIVASLPLADALAVEIGDRLPLPDGGEMLVMGLEARAGRLTLEGVPVSLPAAAVAPPPPSSPAFPPVLLPPPGPTRVHLLDFPGLLREEDEPLLPVAMAGSSAAWRNGSLLASRDGGESFAVVAETAAPAVIGDVEQPPGAGPTTFWDEANSLTVRLLRPEMSLESRSALSVLNGGNLAMVGAELIQFRDAVLQADGSYRLSGLLRGRQGTEHAVAGHTAGEPFVLIDGGGLADARIPLALAGRSVLVKPVSNVDDPDAIAADAMTVPLNALKPLSPAHLRAVRLASGDVRITWIRRTRRNGEWLDGADVPLGEECACYEVEICDAAGQAVRTLQTAQESAVYTAADQQADFGALPAVLTLRVYQLSAKVGRGRPAEATFAL